MTKLPEASMATAGVVWSPAVDAVLARNSLPCAPPLLLYRRAYTPQPLPSVRLLAQVMTKLPLESTATRAYCWSLGAIVLTRNSEATGLPAWSNRCAYTPQPLPSVPKLDQTAT